MRRLWRLLVASVGLFGAIQALAVTPVPLPITGNLGAISGTGQPYAGVSIQLQNCPSPISITGYFGIVQTGYQIRASSSGLITGSIWSNDLITCNGTTGNSQYNVTLVNGGVPSGTPQCYQVVSTQGAWNMNTQQPIACSQTPPNPQDAQYRNLNVTGCFSVDGGGCSGGGVSQIIPGTNVTISPSGGQGAVTINASGGFSGTIAWPGSLIMGDSIPFGYAATSYALSFGGLLASQLGGTQNNVAVGGWQCTDESLQLVLAGSGSPYNGSAISAPTQGNNPLAIGSCGKNEQLVGCISGNCLLNSAVSLTTVAAYLGTNNIVPVSQCVESGTWAADSVIPQAQASHTNGSALDCGISTYGSTGAIGISYRAITSNGGTASVTIDGVAQTGIAGTGNGGSSISGAVGSALFTTIYPVAAGTHTVHIAITSATSSSNIISIPFLVANPNPSSLKPAPPSFGTMEQIPLQNNANTGLAAINTSEQGVMTSLASHGFGTKWLPITNVPCTYGTSGCTGGFNSAGYISNQGPAAITSYACTSGTCTFQSANNFVAGALANIYGFVTSKFLNGKTATVISSGLSTSQFELVLGVPNASATESGMQSGVDPDGLQCSGTLVDDTHPNNCGDKQMDQALQIDYGIVQASASPGGVTSACGPLNPPVYYSTAGSYTVPENACGVLLFGGANLTVPGTFSQGQSFFVSNIDPSNSSTVTNGGSGGTLGASKVLGPSTGICLANAAAPNAANWFITCGYNLPQGSLALTQNIYTTNHTLNASDGIVIMQCASACTLTMPTLTPNAGPFFIVATSATVTVSFAGGSAPATLVAPSGFTASNSSGNWFTYGYWGTVGLAVTLQGGINGDAYYSTGATSAAGWIHSPTTASHFFLYGWEPAGSAVDPQAYDLNTFNTTINGTACPLTGSCSISASALTIQTNSVNNTSQTALNFITSTVNGMGITITPSNPATSSEKMEATGTVNATSGGTGADLHASTGLVRAGNPFTVAEISGDCTTSGTNAITCTKTSGTAFGGYATLTLIANATTTVGTSAITANSCTSATTVTMTGLATTSTINMTPNADISATVGWSPSTSGVLYIVAWPTSNTLNYKVCNPTTSSITPGGSVTFNVSAR